MNERIGARPYHVRTRPRHCRRRRDKARVARSKFDDDAGAAGEVSADALEKGSSPVKELLQNLNRFKYGKIEIDFRRELDHLETYAKSIDLKPAPKSVSGEPRTAEQILNEAARLTTDFPEPAVGLGWTAIEH